ncbi:MAG: O-antigen ligase family protein [Syntrophobacteraceae bacterium]|nr:O-antigen ligase family protein [Syntrophobacteraceae bacterium]
MLLIFSPLAQGSAPRWAFCICLWLTLVAFKAMFLRRLWQGETILPRSPIDLPIAVLIIFAAASWTWSIYPDATLWAFLRLLLYTAVFYMTVEMTESRRQTRRLVQVIVAMGLIVSFLGLVKYAGAPFPSFWKGEDPNSLNSTFVNRDHLAGYLAMIFTLGLGMVFHRTTDRVMIWAGALFVILVAVCLSLSRGAWTGIFIAVELMLVLFMVGREAKRFKIGIVASALLLVVGVTLLGSNAMIARMETLKSVTEDSSFYGRTVAWGGSLKIIEKSPLLGAGLGAFPWSFPYVRPAGLTMRWREAHNDWLQIVTELGLPVLLPLLWGLGLLFRRGLRIYKATPSRLQAGVILGALGGITAILVHSIVDFNIQITSNGILFACLVGLAAGPYSWAGKTFTQSPVNTFNGGSIIPTTAGPEDRVDCELYLTP